MNKALLAMLIGLSSIFWVATEFPVKMMSSSAPISRAPSDNTIELGNVTWKRDLEEAKKASADSGKPMFVQFQEVPG